jgi:hypothetical protein
MKLHLIAESESGRRQHRNKLQSLLKKTDGTVRIASAYVTDTHLLSGIKDRDVRLLTYLSKMDIIGGASSLDSLTALIKAGVQCRYMSHGPRLHAKVYVFDDKSAVVTSANLTRNALDNNIEVGVHLSLVAHKLISWFDALWNERAEELDLATLSKLRRETEGLRAEYSALRKTIEKEPTLVSEARLSVTSAKRLRDLFKTASRFFVCNTNRKHSPDDEGRMHGRGYAAAWEEFRYPTHMDRVRQGDAIFMFAKGQGIIGIGCAKARRVILEPADSDRIKKKGTTREWRVPVDWLDWKKDRSAFRRLTSPNSTFFDVTGDKYGPLRDGVRTHFLRQS